MAGEGANASGWQRSVGAYASLVRVPNLFTAPPDVVLGAALAASAVPGSPAIASVAGLAVASMLLYAGGTTLNDAFDAPVDARERPERPIPSGTVDRMTAFGLGGGLLVAGVAVAFLAAGVPSGVVAAAIAVGILLYDGALKGGSLGFLTMGTVRGLNVLLGLSAVGYALLFVPLRTFLVPAVIAAYIAAVTYMAVHETGGGSPTAVAVTVAGALTAVAVLFGRLLLVGAPLVATISTLVLGAGFLWWVSRPLRVAYADPLPENVGPAVGACVLGLVILDAAFAAATGLEWGLAVLVFLVPAWGLSTAFDVT